ncbi:MAG: zf-HC2 domain-containing protein [Solirubrobacteraceae bacterium MAG38_C4-C5]|nr:zf-HC2 domain-containing protein [Candidatus Siliceabacter maunaloa]
MPRGVTPAGIRDGEPASLAGLVELRGSAVMAYASGIVAPEAAVQAAAQAMARFRSHVVEATDLGGLDPDTMLLCAVRESSAQRVVHHPARSGRALHRLTRRGGSACRMAPRLLAARANRELAHEDAVRLDQHLASCPGCRALRERFRDGERSYAEAAGRRLREPDARALLLALAGAGPLATGTREVVAAEALDMLPPEVVTRPGRFPAPPALAPPETSPAPDAASAPAEAPAAEAPAIEVPAAEGPAIEAPQTEAVSADPWPANTPPPPATYAPPSQARPTDPWPGNSAAVDYSPTQRPPPREAPDARNGRDAAQPNGAATAGAPAARRGGGVGTAHGRVSFGRRTVVIRSGMQGSGPAVSPPSPDGEPMSGPATAKLPGPPAESRPAEHPRPEAHDPEDAPEGHEVGEPMPPPAARTSVCAPSPNGGPGAPPDSGMLARVLPGILIATAIAIALLVAGILGAGNTPATSDDVAPPSLREQDTSGTPRTPAGAGIEATN